MPHDNIRSLWRTMARKMWEREIVFIFQRRYDPNMGNCRSQSVMSFKNPGIRVLDTLLICSAVLANHANGTLRSSKQKLYSLTHADSGRRPRHLFRRHLSPPLGL